MRLVYLLSILMSSPICAKEWKTEFFSISVPSEFEIEVTGEKYNFAAFVFDERYGHPKEMLVIEFGKTDDLKTFIRQGNDFLSELSENSGKLRQEPCKPKCSLYASEVDLRSEGSSKYHFLRVIQNDKHVYALSYFGVRSKTYARNFLTKIMQQINANGI
ncbi:MAG: hypothetical protein KZQ77_06335 [Candidatus Thiodiazotropha sp. (ex Notomyrtea botanica)]|nr:hypothetical protein [Candidatus Thiodiazotropha sp. (ex Notomyrtea botanica)]